MILGYVSVARLRWGAQVPSRKDRSMNVHRTLAMTAILAGVVTCSSAVHAQSKKIQRAELPPAVEKTVVEQSKGATIQGFSTEVEDGKKLYEAALTVNGHARSIEMDEQGNLLETEDEVAIASLPPAVKAALTKAAGAGTIEKVETLTKKGKLVAYEADVKTGTKHSEIQVGPIGKKLAHPE
jgi:uncharacterized membrane protein YkoI